MFGPSDGLSNNLALPWKRFIACWFFTFARFIHLNYRNIKQLSRKRGEHGHGYPAPPPSYAPVVVMQWWQKNVQESVMQVQSCGFAYSFQPIERFHMTSRWPYWCSKTKKRRPCSVMLVFQTNQVGVELFSYVKNFFVPINLHTFVDAGHVSENSLLRFCRSLCRRRCGILKSLMMIFYAVFVG